MKKLFSAITLVLALNFLIVAGGAGWLFRTGHLDRERVTKIKELLFPKPVAEVDPNAPSTQPAPTSQPSVRLDELLAKASGRTAGEQVEFIQQTFDTEVAQLDRKQRELADLQRQVDLAKEQMIRDRAKLDQDQKELVSREQQQTKLATDKGFQDSLLLYTTMQPKQVKTIFMTLTDDVVQRYLQAMEPRTASKIIKEFKSQEEVDRIQRVLEKIRQAGPPAAPVPQPASAQPPALQPSAAQPSDAQPSASAN